MGTGSRAANTSGRLIALFVLALTVRLLAGCWWQSRLPAERRFFFADSESYWQLAQTIYRGQPYQFANEDARVFRTPGFPATLSLLFQLLGDDNPSVYWARAWMALLGTFSVAGVMVIAGQLFGRNVAWLAGLISALHPESITLGTFVLSEAAFCPCMLAHLACWIAASRNTRVSRSLIWAGAGGAIAGLAILIRPSWLLFLPFATVLGLIRKRDRWRTVGIAGAMAIMVTLVLSPWWIRNYQITGSFVPTTLQVGASLYDGLSPDARGGSDMQFAPRFIAQLREKDRLDPNPSGKTFEERLDRWLFAESVAWARQHPAQVAKLAVNKFARIWSPWPNDQGFGSILVRFGLASAYVPLMVLAFIGMKPYLFGEWPYQLCLLPAVYFTTLHMVFVGSIRYRQPPLLLLTAFAAAAIAHRLRTEPATLPVPTT